jgi:hypothetical protein
MPRHDQNVVVVLEANQRHGGEAGRIITDFVVTTALLFATPGLTADWLAPGADQTVMAPWIMDLTAQLERDLYRDVFMNALGNSSQTVVVQYLNNATQALQVTTNPWPNRMSIKCDFRRRHATRLLQLRRRGAHQEIDPHAGQGRCQNRNDGDGNPRR